MKNAEITNKNIFIWLKSVDRFSFLEKKKKSILQKDISKHSQLNEIRPEILTK